MGKSNPNSLKNLSKPWKPGQTGNPNGRPTAGASIREQINIMVCAELTESELRLIARDKNLAANRRIAAERIIKSMEAGDLSDFDPWMNGEVEQLSELRSRGVNTEVVKRSKVKVRRVPGKEGEEFVEREIELHDRAREEMLTIINTTALSPAEEDKARRLDEGMPTENVKTDNKNAFSFDNLRKTFYEAMGVDSGRRADDSADSAGQ